MKLDEYQKQARKTDVVKNDGQKDFLVPLTGLIGEVGSLISEYKKYLRDGKAYANFTEHMQEELGDTLWYIATLAGRYNLKLSQIVNHTLMLRSPTLAPLLDEEDKEKIFGDGYKVKEEELNGFQEQARLLQRFDVPEQINLFAALMETSNKAGELIDKIMHLKNFEEQQTLMTIGLGSLLWQLSYIASIREIKLSDVAKFNLDKIVSRWPGDNPEHTPLFDEEYPEHEQFPRNIEIVFKGYKSLNGKDFTIMSCNGIQIGARLTDNTYEDSGYRFHDAIHYAFIAILGWSPVMRGLFNLKRKSNDETDEVEDGARAGIIEEAVVILTYDYASDQDMLKGQNAIDHSRIKIIQKLCRELEVGKCKPWEWCKAILKGYEMFRELRDNEGGVLLLDLNKRNIEYRKL